MLLNQPPLSLLAFEGVVLSWLLSSWFITCVKKLAKILRRTPRAPSKTSKKVSLMKVTMSLTQKRLTTSLKSVEGSVESLELPSTSESTSWDRAEVRFANSTYWGGAWADPCDALARALEAQKRIKRHPMRKPQNKKSN